MAGRLAAAGFATVADLLLALPFRYEDRRRFSSVADLAWGSFASAVACGVGARFARRAGAPSLTSR